MLLGVGYLRDQFILADLQPVHSLIPASRQPGFQCAVDGGKQSNPGSARVWAGTWPGHVHHDLGQPHQYFCATLGWSKKRPDLEQVWSKKGMDPAGCASCPVGFPVHTIRPECVGDHGIYPDHQYRDGPISFTNSSLAGRSLPGERPQQGEWIDQFDGRCGWVDRIFWRRLPIRPLWKICSFYRRKHHNFCSNTGGFAADQRTQTDQSCNH